jgi:RNase P protein component
LEDRDLVVIARRSGAALSFEQLDRQLSKLMGLTPRVS